METREEFKGFPEGFPKELLQEIFSKQLQDIPSIRLTSRLWKELLDDYITQPLNFIRILHYTNQKGRDYFRHYYRQTKKYSNTLTLLQSDNNAILNHDLICFAIATDDINLLSLNRVLQLCEYTKMRKVPSSRFHSKDETTSLFIKYLLFSPDKNLSLRYKYSQVYEAFNAIHQCLLASQTKEPISRNNILSNITTVDCERLFLNLSNIKLPQSDFLAVPFPSANLTKADLREANMLATYLVDVNFSSACLSKANLSSAMLERANLTLANLEEANLENAKLTDAILIGSNLKGAKLDNANLQGTRFIRNIALDSIEKLNCELDKIKNQFDATKYNGILKIALVQDLITQIKSSNFTIQKKINLISAAKNHFIFTCDNVYSSFFTLENECISKIQEEINNLQEARDEEISYSNFLKKG